MARVRYDHMPGDGTLQLLFQAMKYNDTVFIHHVTMHCCFASDWIVHSWVLCIFERGTYHKYRFENSKDNLDTCQMFAFETTNIMKAELKETIQPQD